MPTAERKLLYRQIIINDSLHSDINQTSTCMNHTAASWIQCIPSDGEIK